VIGQRILVPFRVHHLNPDDFLRRGFLDTNGDVAAISVPLLLGLLLMPLESNFQHAAAFSGFAFCAVGGSTNQIHQWAHMPSPPGGVKLLQRLGLVLGPREHAVHHQRPYHGHYCITTGWCNGPLEALGFFRRLEAFVTLVTGAWPRADEEREAEEHA
jgi:ubiquitin-conjugating enzyme E2 variant